MAIPNLISLIVLSGVIVAETRLYLWNNNLDATAPESSMLTTDGPPATPPADVSPTG
jgi:AGCS family alanine or glycine:cation symporter